MKSHKIRDYKVDSNLGYLIQQITGDTTQEILVYFYGVAKFVLDDVMKKSKASWVNKDIILFYKDTPITFRIQIAGAGPGSNYKSNVGINVSFPKNSTSHEVDDLMTVAMETGLGLTQAEDMPKFDKPDLKTPRCLRDVRIAQDEQRTKTNA